ncbi:hypothetical protein FZ983_27195 [Azospirillum sp. B21]|uniref:hypothetical protein n=1 Tax=Azospirillum sp. B21 TaxID=2607496 RepID=UPI0011ED5C11|nr:hypothetical protein [Azospirillum sp. B21]KAA0574591.1 hypothetical protein FZ983_27195 [Azospirillum sp. B21]
MILLLVGAGGVLASLVPVRVSSCTTAAADQPASPDPAADRRRGHADRPGADAHLDLHHRGGRPAERR